MALVDLRDSSRYAMGIKYTLDLEMTELILKDRSGEAIVNDKVFLDYIGVSYVDAGAFRVLLRDKRFGRDTSYPVRSDFGRALGDRIDDETDIVLIESGTRQVTARGRTQDISIHIINEGNIDTRVASVSQHATLVPK